MESRNESAAHLPQTGSMRRWILKAGAAGLDDLRLEDAPIPTPGRGQVRIRMNAASLNFRDQIILKGTYGSVSKDIIPLADGAGIIDALGSGVTKFKEGDKVMTIYSVEEWTDGPPVPEMSYGLGADGTDGVLPEYIVLNEGKVTAAPHSLSMIEAATLPCAGVTAWTALKGDRPYINPIKKGEKVLVLGTGGVSLFAMLLGRAMGADIIGTSGSDDKLQKFRDAGAIASVNYNTMDNWGDIIFERTGGANKVVNAVGGAAVEQSLAALAFGGEIATMGLHELGEKPFNYISLMSKGASIRGTAVGSAAAHRDLVAFIDEHHIKPPIDKVFPFEEAVEAYQAAVSRDLFGKIVIQISE